VKTVWVSCAETDLTPARWSGWVGVFDAGLGLCVCVLDAGLGLCVCVSDAGLGLCVCVLDAGLGLCVCVGRWPGSVCVSDAGLTCPRDNQRKLREGERGKALGLIFRNVSHVHNSSCLCPTNMVICFSVPINMHTVKLQFVCVPVWPGLLIC